MGCTSSKYADGVPRAVHGAAPGKRPLTTLEQAKLAQQQPGSKKASKMRRHGTDALVSSDESDATGSDSAGEGKRKAAREVDVGHIELQGAMEAGNSDRRRLSIMRSNHTDPRLAQRGARARNVSNSSASANPDLRDPGDDIGNGAFGENGDHPSLPLLYSCVTRPGNDPAKRQKENQDTYVVHNGLGSDADSFAVCVFDGHGPNGALASHYMRDRLAAKWTEMGVGRKSCQEEGEIRRILHNGCVEVNHKLATSNIDVYVSGSTGIMGVVKKDVLYVANVGDSRAVLGRINRSTGRLEAVDLSDDQKPDRPDEHARIIRNGGRVFEWGVPRVWQRDVDMPGLAMARSFGDLAAESVGVFAEPEISATKLTPDDKFLIFATDGVWEFLSSVDIVAIIGRHMTSKPADVAARDACVEVINASVEKWNAVHDVVDDSTCVIVALDY